MIDDTTPRIAHGIDELGRLAIAFINPSDGQPYVLPVNNAEPVWAASGTIALPTIRPSIDRIRRDADGRVRYRNHFTVDDGRVTYLDDCTHEMRGRVVDLPAISEAWVGGFDFRDQGRDPVGTA